MTLITSYRNKFSIFFYEIIIILVLYLVYEWYMILINSLVGFLGYVFQTLILYPIFMLIIKLFLDIIFVLIYHCKPVKVPVRVSSADMYSNPQEKYLKIRNFCNKVGSYSSGLLAKYPYSEKIILILLTPLEYLHQKREKQFMEENPQFRADMPHNGIVICHSERVSLPQFGFGSDQLVHYFVERQIPYRVYNCSTIDDFVSVIHNDAVQVIWIFGHGDRGGISLKDGYHSYSKIPAAKFHKKISVYQLHCNGGTDEPLSRIIVDGWDFGEDHVRQAYENRAHVEQILAEPDKFPGIWEPVKGKYE